MFPIINTRGKVIGFGGRVLDDGIPKYLNSPESEIFRKKNNLFGINLTRQEISKEGKAILVEGYMDVISLHQRGIDYAVATLGTESDSFRYSRNHQRFYRYSFGKKRREIHTYRYRGDKTDRKAHV